MPDVSLISELGDKCQLGRMLQLMLGVAVNCPKKQSKSVVAYVVRNSSSINILVHVNILWLNIERMSV